MPNIQGSGDEISGELIEASKDEFDDSSLILGLSRDNHQSRNPAYSYLLRLRSQRSRVTMGSFLSQVASMAEGHTIASFPWEGMTRHGIHALLTRLEQSGKAPNTINTYLSALKGVALEARAMRLIDADTFLDIQSIRSVRGFRLPKGRSLSSTEIERLLLVCEADDSLKGVRDMAIIKVLLGCGLRREEVVKLQNPAHVEWDTTSLRIHGKGDKERRAFMPKGTARALRHWIDQARGGAEGAVFTRIRRYDKLTHDQLSHQAIWHILQERAFSAEIRDVSPHDLRRTFATSMLEAGVDLLTLQNMMGHASIETTKKYDKRGEDAMRMATEQFALF